MARTISDEELQLRRRARRRLIGAVVLVTAIVVVLPMVLDSEPRPSGQPISVQIPPPDAGGFSPKLAPVPATPRPKEVTPPPPAKAPEAPAKVAAVPPAPAPAKEAPAPAVEAPKEEARPAAKPQPKAKPAAKAKGGGYVIQVIALADAGKAQQMQQQIAAAGIRSYTEVVKTAKGDVTRVRAGPFATRSAAEKAREQLKTLGMSGNITTK